MFTAQRARSATTLTKKAFTEVKITPGRATLIHPSHVDFVDNRGTGISTVSFDRHVDNCTFSATQNTYGGSGHLAIFALENGGLVGLSTFIEIIDAIDPVQHVGVDTDFDIIALCPAT